MSLELIVELFQHLQLAKSVLAIESRLLSFVILVGLLLLYLLLKVNKHLKDLDFV